MKMLMICMYLGLSVLCVAQEKPLESPARLRSDLFKEQNDSIKVRVMLDLAHYYLEVSKSAISAKQLDSASFYSDRARNLSQKIKYQKGLGSALLLSSEIAFRYDDKTKADSLANLAIKIFEKTGTKTDMANSYLILGKGGFTENLLVYLEKAQKLFAEGNNKKGLADAAREQGYLMMMMGRTKESIGSFQQALKLYSDIGYEKVQLVYGLMAFNLNREGEMDQAVDYALKAIRLVERFKDTSGDAAQIYNYAAGTYLTMRDTARTIEYQKKAYGIVQKHNMVSLKVTIESNLVSNLIGLKKNREALLYLKKLEKQYPIMPEPIQANVASLAIFNYSGLEMYKNAEKYLPVVKAYIQRPSPNKTVQMKMYQALMYYYLGTKDYQQAREMANAYKAICEEKKFNNRLSAVYTVLFRIDSAQQHFDSALKGYRQSRAWHDSVVNETKNKQIAELEIQYQTDKKEKDNKLLLKQNELQQTKLQQSDLVKNISIGGIFLLLAFLGLLYSRYTIKRRSNKQLEAQKEEIDQKNGVLQKLVREKEWLLKEVHHRVKNNLQIIMSLLNIQSYFLTDDAAMTAIRNSQHRIHSMSLIHKKLYQSDNVVAIDMPNYIKDLIEYFKEFFGTAQRIRFVAEIAPVSLDISQAVPLGLILNEAITNAIKHAFPGDRTGTITVKMKSYENLQAELIIADNGIGSTVSSSAETSSLGMKLMDGFASDLEARLEISSVDGFGVFVGFTIKLISEQNNVLSNLSA